MQPAVSQSECRHFHTEGNMKVTKQENQTLFSFVKLSCTLKEKMINKSRSSTNSPEKTDPKPPSANVNTSTHSGNVNLNVVLNRVQNQPPSLSSDSYIEIIPPDKNYSEKNFFEKAHYHYFIPASVPRIVLSHCT